MCIVVCPLASESFSHDGALSNIGGCARHLDICLTGGPGGESISRCVETVVGMGSILLRADPPGTINPAKLSAAAKEQVVAGCPAITWVPEQPETQAPVESIAPGSLPTTELPPSSPGPDIPCLSRISSDWDPEDEIVLRKHLNYEHVW